MLLPSLILSLASVAPIVALDEFEAPPVQDPALDFPEPKADMLIPVDEQGTSWTMLKLVNEYARLSDQHFVLTPEATNLLGSVSTGLIRSVQVPKADVQSMFERLLYQNHFALRVLRAEAPRLLAVDSLISGSRQGLRQNATFVPEELLEKYGDHPAMMITTIVHLPNTDVRQLSNSMRTMITDANTQQMLPAGNTNSMVLTGFGGQVAGLVSMLRLTDKTSQIAGESTAADTMDPVFERFPLANAVAAEVSASIEELVNSSSRRQTGTQAGNPQALYTQRGHTDARVLFDARTNALVVMAMPYDMKKVKMLVGLFDRAE